MAETLKCAFYVGDRDGVELVGQLKGFEVKLGIGPMAKKAGVIQDAKLIDDGVAIEVEFEVEDPEVWREIKELMRQPREERN